MSESHFKTFLRGSFISLFGVGLLGILNYLVRRHLSLSLSEADYGMFYSIFALLSVIFGFSDLGMTQSGMALIAKNAETNRYNDCFGVLLMFKGGITLIVFGGVFVFSTKLSRDYLHISSVLPLVLMAGMMVFQAIDGSFKALWNSLKLFGQLQVFQVLGGILLLGGVWWCVPRYGLVGAVGVFFAVPIILSVLGAIYGVKTSRVDFHFRPNVGIWREMFKLSGYVAISTTMLSTVYYMDTVMLTALKGVNSSAMYNIALPIMQIIQSLMIFPNVFLPIAMEMGTKHDYRSLRRFSMMAMLLTLIAAPCVYLGFWWGAEWLITLLFSSKYVSAAPAVPLLCTGLIFCTLSNFNFQILLGLGKTGNMALIACIAAICNVLLNWILIEKFDFIGASWATMISYGLLAGLSGSILIFHLRKGDET